MAEVRVLPAAEADLAEWVRLRRSLWPRLSPTEADEECRALVQAEHEAAFLAWRGERAVGFIEGSLRGTVAQPYGHVEGWYVDPACQGQGVGQMLMGELTDWFLHHQIRLLHSDTSADYPLSPAAHERAGFEEVGVIRIFRKTLG